MACMTAQGFADGKIDFLLKLKQFLVTHAGWTLHDDLTSEGVPEYVLYSAGENGLEDIYLQINDRQGTQRSTFIPVDASMYWNNTTHTAVFETIDNWDYRPQIRIPSDPTSVFLFWFFADKNKIYIVTKIGHSYYRHFSGLMKRLGDRPVYVVKEALSSGMDVQILVDDTQDFYVGQKICIKDNANFDIFSVVEKGTGYVVASELSHDFGAGSKFGVDPQPVFSSTGSKLYMFNSMKGASSPYDYFFLNLSTMPRYTYIDSRLDLAILFPYFIDGGTDGYYGKPELRGELDGVYSYSAIPGERAIADEDIIVVGDDHYKCFSSYAIKEGVRVELT